MIDNIIADCTSSMLDSTPSTIQPLTMQDVMLSTQKSACLEPASYTMSKAMPSMAARPLMSSFVLHIHIPVSKS